MKFVSLSIVIMLINACSQNSDKNNEIVNNTNPIEVSSDTLIFGKWALCATFDDKKVIQFNVCPVIHFEKSGKGKINDLETFTWSLRKSHLTVDNFLSKNNSILGSGDYFATIRINENKSISLDLRQQGVTLYLSK